MNEPISKPMSWRIFTLLAVLVAGSASMAVAPPAHAAGDVNVSVDDDGNLIIRGDDRDNNILIIPYNKDGSAYVLGRAGTTVNGRTGRNAFGYSSDINITMKGGDDFVRVDGLIGSLVVDDLKIDTGSGDDIVELFRVTVADFTGIATGRGNDTVFIDGIFLSGEFIGSDFQGPFRLQMGDGDDLAEIFHATFRNEVNVHLGAGSDGLCIFVEEPDFQGDPVVFDGGSGSKDNTIVSATDTFSVVNFEHNSDNCTFFGGRRGG